MASSSEPEPVPLYDQTAFRRDLLAILQAMPRASGLQLKAVLDEAWGTTINHGRLYPNLDELVTKGLVRKDEADGRTNTYELTPRGERAVASHYAWIRQFRQDGSDE